MSKFKKTHKTKKQITDIKEDQTVPRTLLKGPFPELSKMKKEQIQAECQMWRNVWQWVPDEVKYYVARTGQTIALTMRNYKRYLGVLLDTHWTLDEIEVGTYDKVYDIVDGRHYYERKIIKTRIGGLIDVQWIAERKPEQIPSPPIEDEQRAYTEQEEAKTQEPPQEDNTVLQ